MPPKSLSEWLDILENIHGSQIDLGLLRMKQAVGVLDLSSLNVPVIMVAGTNGKGSVVCALEHIYSSAGYRVGSYTSPHLYQFNERIKINTQSVSDEILISAFSATHAAARIAELTYFEAITLAALWIFKYTPLDILILEVGLGGRLDAVNVIDPTLAIITNIDLDHTDRLGDTRDAIAKEKAGIFREQIPVVCGDRDPPAILSKLAAEKSAPFYWAKTVADLPDNGLLPENMFTALTAIEQLQYVLPVPQEAIHDGLRKTHLPGRQQIMHKKCKHLIDVAHNPAGLQKLAQKIVMERGRGKVLLVISMLQDKDLQQSFATLQSQIDAWFVAPLEHPRSASSAQLSDTLQALSIDAIIFSDIEKAYQAAMSTAQADDLLVVTGSFFTLAALSKEFAP